MKLNENGLSKIDFELKDEFLHDYKWKNPWENTISYLVYKRTYARPLPNGETERWWQTVKRVVEGTYTIQKRYCVANNLHWSEKKANNSAEKMYDLIFNFKFTPPGRGLWMMGTDYVFERNTNAPLMNCSFVTSENITTDFAEPFCFLMDMSMLGVGVGGDTRGAGKLTVKKPKVGDWTFTVPDSREGWVESVKILLNGYGHGKEIPSEFDYSDIRDEGEPLKGFGGTSSGAKPLIELHDNIRKLLDQRIGEKIKSTDIVDLFNLIGKCVVAGNVRRSAEIMFGEPDDDEFLNLKDPDHQTDFWGEEERFHHRWSSNNSVFSHKGMDYNEPVKKTIKNGEPGYIWLDKCRKYGRLKDEPNNKDYRVYGTNPCGEQPLEPFECCNLVETYPVNHDSLEDWKETLKYAYLYAKTVTLMDCHNKRANAIMMRNRRIGCSISGITQAFTKFGRRDFFKACDEGYDKIQNWDKTYSEWLCVPRSIKTTTVKPSGTVSQLAKVTSGIHFPISEYYIRRVRFSKHSPLLKELKKAGYNVEDSLQKDDSKIVEFPVKQEHFDRSESEVSIWEQFEMTAQMQKYWSDNAVSVTIKFNEDEEADIPRALEFYEDKLKTISLLPNKEGTYEQAPYEPITEERYEEMVNELEPIKLSGDTHEMEDKFCEGEACLIE